MLTLGKMVPGVAEETNKEITKELPISFPHMVFNDRQVTFQIVVCYVERNGDNCLHYIQINGSYLKWQLDDKGYNFEEQIESIIGAELKKKCSGIEEKALRMTQFTMWSELKKIMRQYDIDWRDQEWNV